MIGNDEWSGEVEVSRGSTDNAEGVSEQSGGGRVAAAHDAVGSIDTAEGVGGGMAEVGVLADWPSSAGD